MVVMASVFCNQLLHLCNKQRGCAYLTTRSFDDGAGQVGLHHLNAQIMNKVGLPPAHSCHRVLGYAQSAIGPICCKIFPFFPMATTLLSMSFARWSRTSCFGSSDYLTPNYFSSQFLKKHTHTHTFTLRIDTIIPADSLPIVTLFKWNKQSNRH